MSDPDYIRARIGELDELGVEVLTHLHLILAPGYGTTADNIVRGAIQQQKRARQQGTEADLLLVDTPSAGRPAPESSAALQQRIATLTQQGLLLSFRQQGIDYTSLPAAVRPHLPRRPDLFAGYDKGDSLAPREISIGQRIQSLYAVWTAIAGGRPDTEQGLSRRPLTRQAAPSRRPIEDTWVALQDWNNDPEEISTLESGTGGRGPSGFPRLNRYSSSTLNWKLAVAPPPCRLSDEDMALVRLESGCSALETEFCYALLEALGALSAAPGQPVSANRQAMYRFLRASLVDKVHTLWRAWAAAEAWSEMESVLRAPQAGRPGSDRLGTEPLRLRRSMAYSSFKPADLYEEWRDARQTVLRFLSLLDEERWVTVDGFLQAIHNVHPDLLHNQTDSSVWQLESPKTGKQFGATFEDWQRGQGQFVLAMLQGPLYWLGLIRLGYSSATAPTPAAFQLTATGALALGRRATLPISASRTERAAAARDAGQTTCSVSDDLTVTLLPGHAPVELYDLVHSVGSLLEATPDRFIYRLSASRVQDWAEAAARQSNASTGIGEAIETPDRPLEQALRPGRRAAPGCRRMAAQTAHLGPKLWPALCL